MAFNMPQLYQPNRYNRFSNNNGEDSQPRPRPTNNSGGGDPSLQPNVISGGFSFGEGPNVTSFEGVDFVNPRGVDYGSLLPAYVNFQNSLNLAYQQGDRNRDIYYGELFGEDSRNAALGLVDTDIAGVLRGLDGLVPRARAEGDIDTQTNINRAGMLDAFNMQRTPAFNTFNRNEVSLNNEFSRGEFAKSVDGTGIDYRNRILGTIGRLEQRAEGNLPAGLAASLDRDLANRGSDILRGSGVSSVSGAGIRANDRLTISERLNLATQADAQLPGVLGGAQQLLTAPFESAPTILSQPTNVPLNVSNVADRIPVTSNISAGAAQQAIAGTATELQTILPTNILSSSLANEQFNAASQYTRDTKVLDSTQGQLIAQDNALQGAINTGNANQIRDEAYQAFQEGFDIRTDSGNAAALGGIGGLIQSGVALAGLGGQGGGASGTTGQQTGGGAGGGGASQPNLLTQGIQYVGGLIDQAFGGGGSSGGGGYDFDPSLGGSTPVGGSSGSVDIPGLVTENPIPGSPQSSSDSLTRAFRAAAAPAPDVATDYQQLSKTAGVMQNWDTASPVQRSSTAGSLGTDSLQKAGVITQDRANQIRGAQSSIEVLTNTASTDGERVAATANLANLGVSTPFTGSVNAPETVGGVRVVGSSADGGFMLADGTSVSQETLLNSSNAASTIQAFSILTSKADDEQKLAALAAVGIKGAAANNLIGQVNAGNSNAALSLFTTTNNWDQMTPVQQATSVVQTSTAVLNAASGYASTSASAASGSGALAYLGSEGVRNTLGTVASGVAIAGGIYAGWQTSEAIKDSPRSQATTIGPVGGAAAGASIGAGVGGPVGAVVGAAIGATIGAVAGHTGSGKDTGQRMRDGWRSGMEEMGIAVKNENGSHEVTLADGSKYDIGKDGGHKLTNSGANIDGKGDRHTFDVDWSNPIVEEAIPDAHIFAIATGLNPTDSAKMNLFDRATAQGLNAAMSNATTLEGARENFKAMLKDTDPREVVARIETMRLTNKISEEEYGVYVDRTNKMFGLDYVAPPREQSFRDLVGMLSSQAGSNKDAKKLLEQVTNPREMEKARQKLEERITGEKAPKQPKVGMAPKDRIQGRPAQSNSVIPTINIPGVVNYANQR